MRKVVTRAGSLIGVASAALLVVGGGLAVASTGARHPVTGPEVASGGVTGRAAIANVPHIPLTLVGVVATTDRGFVLGHGTSNTHTLTTPVGKLTVTGVGRQHQTQSVNATTCRIRFTIRQQFTFVPSLSTGKFAGASGPGAYQVTFAAFMPRFTSGPNKGQCNFGNNAMPLAKGAVARFLVAGVLTVG